MPDENYAREVMQLFSVGVVGLNIDGTVQMQGSTPREIYGQSDIGGLARVFTGWNVACPVAPTQTNSSCFYNGTVNNQSDPDRGIKPMVSYPAFHALEEKRFLGTTIPAGTSGTASLRTALDTLAQHPNVGPFIGRQLIQRLVTSNPSPAYVEAVARAFNNNGAGVRGDLRAVVKAVLLHPEARMVSPTSGKVREPVLRLTALLRAMGVTSDSGDFRIGSTENPGTQLGQSPMSAPSVFNFYRPGYVPPGSATARAGLKAPELQILHETTAAGYVNFMLGVIADGLGQYSGAPFNRRDVQLNLSAEVALADGPTALVDRIDARLMHGGMSAAMKAEIAAAVTSIPLTHPSPNVIAVMRRDRVNTALLLAVISPEFQVQK